ncbi:MAG: hypothetical protein ED557_08515 [Balneola sp.]|nr:MAG: hypothetical protein ED557_08515 [Balneola sp.]
MHDILRYTHVLLGALCLISGLIPMFSKKGGKLHRLSGKLFFWTMFGIFATALLMIFFYRFNYFLLVIAVFSFYMCFTGYRVLYRKKPGEQNWIDWTGAIITTLAGLSFLYLAVTRYIDSGSIKPLIILLTVFGFLTSWSAIEDMIIFRKKNVDDKLWWFYHHMSAFCGAYIAAVTAFAVQMSGTHLAHLEYAWLSWILPAALGTPLISIAKRRYMKKHQSNKPPIKAKAAG